MFMVMMSGVSNGDNIVLYTNQRQAAYTDLRHGTELIEYININGCLIAQYILTWKFLSTLEGEAESKDEYHQQ